MADHTGYLFLPDDTIWPNPPAAAELGWRLRYGTQTRSDLLFAASVIGAYLALIEKTVRRREEAVRLIRAAVASSVADDLDSSDRVPVDSDLRPIGSLNPGEFVGSCEVFGPVEDDANRGGPDRDDQLTVDEQMHRNSVAHTFGESQ